MTAWAYIAHKDHYWAALLSASLPKKDLAKELAGLIADDFAIISVNSREEYDRVMASMKPWTESPEYLAKHKDPRQAELAL